jgi:hypothetical protein
VDWVKRQNEILHIGSDWRRAYTLATDLDISNGQAVCKIRTGQGKLLCEAETKIQEKTVYVTIPSAKTLKIDKAYTKGEYDVFLTVGTNTFKLIMGDIAFIHDVSMH